MALFQVSLYYCGYISFAGLMIQVNSFIYESRYWVLLYWSCMKAGWLTQSMINYQAGSWMLTQRNICTLALLDNAIHLLWKSQKKRHAVFSFFFYCLRLILVSAKRVKESHFIFNSEIKLKQCLFHSGTLCWVSVVERSVTVWKSAVLIWGSSFSAVPGELLWGKWLVCLLSL